MKPTPPKLFLRLFRWFCSADLHVYIEGDLLELYEERLKKSGKRRADLGFIIDVLLLFRPGIIKSLQGSRKLEDFGMFKNYFKITWRNLLKQKMYSAISIGGLSVGLTCFLLIFLYVQHELSYDRFYDNADRIYRIYYHNPSNEYLGSNYFAYTPGPLAAALTNELPEVKYATTMKGHTALLRDENSGYLEQGLWADGRFFNVFAFEFLQGNPETALDRPKSIVLTESLAGKIYSDKNPLGKTLIYQNGEAFTVTGVIKDPPENITFKFSFLAPMKSSYEYTQLGGWDNYTFHTFLILTEGTGPDGLPRKIPDLVEKHIPKDDRAAHFSRLEYILQPLTKIHLENNVNFDIGLKGNPKYVSLFSLIAIIVLLLACINYMNLAVARSIKRAREVGLRKVVGAVRWQLMAQFIGESVLIAFLALLLALGLTHLLLPFFSDLLERPIELDLVENVVLLPGLLLLVVIVGFLSGSYPAFFMSSLRPVQVLKGKIDGRRSGWKMQRWLIIGQYTASIALVISSLVIYQQFRFIHDKELGYDQDHVVAISVADYQLHKYIDALKNEWSGNPYIVSATTSMRIPTNISARSVIRHIDAGSKEDGLKIFRSWVNYDYPDVFGIELIAGRSFSTDIKTDSAEARILNETAAKAMGWAPEEAIGKQFSEGGDIKTVIGVIGDFHMHSMHTSIKPLMLIFGNRVVRYISVKVRPENINETLAYLETSIKKYSPYPFEYKFMDEQFDQLYKADLRLGKMFGFFTLLAILISSLGLFGLAAFTASQRIKEIGIRKVLGASVQGIVGILATDFLKMVLLGFLFAVPVAWYVMSGWLQDFAYRIEMEWWMFAMAGFFATIIALFTISSQSIKAALTNPVNCLRNE